MQLPVVPGPMLSQMGLVEFTGSCDSTITGFKHLRILKIMLFRLEHAWIKSIGFPPCMNPEVTFQESETGHTICEIPNSAAIVQLFVEYCTANALCISFSMCCNTSNFFLKILMPLQVESD